MAFGSGLPDKIAAILRRDTFSEKESRHRFVVILEYPAEVLLYITAVDEFRDDAPASLAWRRHMAHYRRNVFG
jgi:hypothetical protein